MWSPPAGWRSTTGTLSGSVPRVAVTGMPETYRARHALRDTGLALGLPPQVVDRVAKSFPHIRACDIRSALAELPELRLWTTAGSWWR